ncbi:MAG: ABC transporter ATP-binding protein [Clostridiales bacterium]|nr:ABC transporter ATP-binding protein [Clostridiales bacterium]
MKQMLRDIWNRDRKGFLTILILNVIVSMTGGISIVMLIPMLGLLDISQGSVSALAFFTAPLQNLPYGAQVCMMVGLYFALVVFRAMLSRMLSLKETAFLESYSYNLRDALYQTVSKADWEKLAASRQTDTITLFTAQCNQVSYGVADIIHLFASLVSALVQLCIAIWLSLPVTIFVIICGGVFILAFKKMFRISKEYGDELIKINRSMYSELINQLRSVKEVRTYNVQKEHAALFENISDSFRQAKMKFTRLRAVPQVIYSCAAAFMIGIIFVVSVLIFKMDTARLMVLVYVFMRLWPVFSGVYGRIQSILTSVPAYEKLKEAMDNLSKEEAEPENAPRLSFEKQIEFRDVSFAYQGSEEAVLRHVSFTLDKGSITALVGRSGAGKTTIADLLLGFLQPTEGEILIDGVALNYETLPGWRHGLGYIPQEPLILNASVRENLQRFHPHATEEEMIEALKKSQAWGFVSNLKEGLDTTLGDQGVRLSGGERQRIVLARVLLGNPRLIIMDEATSAMDYESETAVRQAIRELDKQITVVVIAHRLATVRTAQNALVLENGTITEDGNLTELLNRPDGYLNRLLFVE